MSLYRKHILLVLDGILILDSGITYSVIRSNYKNIAFQIVVSPRIEDPTAYDYCCISTDAKVIPFLTYPFLLSLSGFGICLLFIGNFLNVSIFYDPVNLVIVMLSVDL